MAEQFSVPQERVSKELEGEGYSWPAPGPLVLACLGEPSQLP